jgi:radical SAM protein with 4Fe4S-binding SPASM domain
MSSIDPRRGLLVPDFNVAPLLTIWETTRSCALACRHCRASADWGRDPRELSTLEGFDLIDQVAAMGTPLMVMSGGDPLNRPDLEDLIKRAKVRNLRVATIPAATPSATKARIKSLKDAGIDQIAVSIDAPNAHGHDNFRRVEGSFAKSLEIAQWTRELGVSLQVNTCFAAWNFQYLDEMAELVTKLGAAFWEVFFLVPTGRGTELPAIEPCQFEEAFAKLDDLARSRDFIVKLTEAQHYRRFQAQRRAKDKAGRSPTGPAVNSGQGFMFVDRLGDICPSGFLPMVAGNVRTHKLADVYRDSPLFVSLRRADQLKGKCAACEFRHICGGSRARAHAMTGDPLQTDPGCAYEPSVASR